MEDQTPSIISKLQHEMEVLSTEIHESELSEDTKQVAVSVAGYIAKSLAKKSACDECRLKLVAEQRDIDHDDYLILLSRGGLITPSPSLRDFVFQTFSILDFTSPMLHEMTDNKNIRKVTKIILTNIQNNVINFTCENHEAWGRKFSIRASVNIFYNNEQKIANDSVRKDQISDFKKRQTRKE